MGETMEALKQDDGLQQALDHCDKAIAESDDDIIKDFFMMIKHSLLSDGSMLDMAIDILNKHGVK